jgi:UDP-glucose 4-epimerase
MNASPIIVTGSSGTIGTELVKRLDDRGADVSPVDYVGNRWSDRIDDLTTKVDLRESGALDDLPPDAETVIHLGARARVHDLVEDPKGARDNIEMTFNVLEYARKNDIEDIVFASSREVYGNTGKVVYSEEDTFVNKAESPYTASKVGGESFANAYENCYGINSCILRFSNVYGRYDASDRVIPLFIAQASAGEPLTVYGEDKVLDFTHLDDCVDGILGVLDNYEKVQSTTLNIASGEGSSILEVAKQIASSVDREVDIDIQSSRTGEVSRYVADISKAKKLIDYSPEYSLSDGINRTTDWYQDRAHLFEEIHST